MLTVRVQSASVRPGRPQTLLSHDTLLQTLARVLREDGKRSIDLCTNIISVFFSVSNFTQFHSLIMQNQVTPRRCHSSMRPRAPATAQTPADRPALT